MTTLTKGRRLGQIPRLAAKILAIFVGLGRENNLLYESWQLVNKAIGTGGTFSIEDLLERPSDQLKQARQTAMVRALELYLLSFTGPRREERSVEYELISLTYAQALDQSETSLKIWKAAIETPINSLLA